MIAIILYASVIILMLIMFQDRSDLGLADHVLQDKHAAFAATVDNLGDGLRPAHRNGWLVYIKKVYPLPPLGLLPTPLQLGRARWSWLLRSIMQ